MNTFDQFKITRKSAAYTGNKIGPQIIIGKQIIIHKYKIEPSKFAGKGERLTLQITYADELRIVFTSSKILMEMLEQVPKDGFPFTTTIKTTEDKGYEFT